jgi:hypothetical protein
MRGNAGGGSQGQGGAAQRFSEHGCGGAMPTMVVKVLVEGSGGWGMVGPQV